MIPTTPYLIRAIYDWCEDQGFTPHILVDASIAGVDVPQHLVENGSIVLNIQSSAVRGLELGNEWIVFSARFSGQAMDISVPVSAVRAVFARENSLGCAFEPTVELTEEEAAQAMDEIDAELENSEKGAENQAADNPVRKKPNLKLVD